MMAVEDKIKLRYSILLEKYGPTIQKKEYAQIFGISVSSINKYLAKGGINLAPYQKFKPLGKRKGIEAKNSSKIYWDTLEVAIHLERSMKTI